MAYHPKQAAYNRKWRNAHPIQWAAISKAAYLRRYADPVRYKQIMERHRQTERWVTQLCAWLKAGIPCQDCGQQDLANLMDFDHVASGPHPRSPGSARSIPELQRMLVDVEIVCVRCHRIRTERRRRATKTKT